MPGPESAARGRALIASRVAAAPAAVAAVPAIFEGLLERPARLPRCLVTTGIGTSEGHARHLAELATRVLGRPARFVATGALASGPPPGAGEDWLVVFSQGLSANARHALGQVEAWGGVVLVTGLSPAALVAEEHEKRAWLAALEARGVVRIELGCGAEYGALVRVVGARVGYAVAWSLLRTLARRTLAAEDPLAIDPAALARAQAEAPRLAERLVPANERVSDFFARERALLLVGEGGELDYCDHLPLKLAEGWLRPQPRALDVLHFAHGPLQSFAEERLSLVYLEPGGDAPPSRWLPRLAASLDPARHDLRPLRPSLPMPFAALELEAVFDALMLRSLDETGLDLVDWPGAARESALYAVGPALEGGAPGSELARAPAPAGDSRVALEGLAWPEIEHALGLGRRAAILALGSIEQHGPHLPLGTDRWIADALAEALARRVGDALALPAMPFGCASEHLDFAGTLHVEPATLESLLADLLASLRVHGFERVFLFSAHGGNANALRAMKTRLVAGAAPLTLALETDLDVGLLQARIVAAAGLAPAAAGPHAGEYETSLVAWLRPGAVRAGARVAGPLPVEDLGDALFYPSVRRHAPDGVLGDPRGARRERGPAYLGEWVDALESAYRAAFPAAGAAGVAQAGSVSEKKRKWTKGAQKA